MSAERIRLERAGRRHGRVLERRQWAVRPEERLTLQSLWQLFHALTRKGKA